MLHVLVLFTRVYTSNRVLGGVHMAPPGEQIERSVLGSDAGCCHQLAIIFTQLSACQLKAYETDRYGTAMPFTASISTRFYFATTRWGRAIRYALLRISSYHCLAL